MTVVVVLFVLFARYEGRSVAWFPKSNGPVCLKEDDLLLILLRSNSASRHEIKAKLLMAKRLVKWQWFHCDLAIIASLWGIVILLVFFVSIYSYGGHSRCQVQKNRPFLNCLLPLCQSEFLCESILVKMCSPLRVHFHANQTDFLMTGLHKDPFFKKKKCKEHKRTRKSPMYIYFSATYHGRHEKL